MSASEPNPQVIIEPTEYRSEESHIEPDTLYTQFSEQIKILSATVERQAATIAELTHELDWFRRNMFGKKSETSKGFDDYTDPGIHQMSIFDSLTEQEKLMLGMLGKR